MGSKRGFALLSPEERRAVSSKGGKAAHELGRAHTFTKEEARKHGRTGGLVSGLRRQKFAGGETLTGDRR